MNKIKIRNIILVQIAFFIYSISSLFSKMAAYHNSNISKVLLYYGGALIMLGSYAIIWQQILKKTNLSTAYANKGMVIIWGMILGALFFKEKVTITMILGAIIIIFGMIMITLGGNKNG